MHGHMAHHRKHWESLTSLPHSDMRDKKLFLAHPLVRHVLEMSLCNEIRSRSEIRTGLYFRRRLLSERLPDPELKWDLRPVDLTPRWLTSSPRGRNGNKTHFTWKIPTFVPSSSNKSDSNTRSMVSHYSIVSVGHVVRPKIRTSGCPAPGMTTGS